MSENNGQNTDSTGQDSYNHGGMLAFVFSMVFCFAFFVYIVAIHPGVDLKENIKDVPTGGAPAAVKVDLSTITEPWKPNPDLVGHGAKLYAQNCAMCHGTEGKGDGPAGLGLNPKPRNLVEGPWKKGGGYIGLYTVLTEGIPGSSMAAYKHFKAIDRWAMVQYIDSITKAKVSEDPQKVESFAKTAN